MRNERNYKILENKKEILKNGVHLWLMDQIDSFTFWNNLWYLKEKSNCMYWKMSGFEEFDMRFKRTMGFYGSPGSHGPISIALSLKEHLSDRVLT